MVQSATPMYGMQSAKQAYQRAYQAGRSKVSAARSKISGRWDAIKGDIGKLQDAMICINTNSCSSDQQAYIKSLVKKVALGMAAAMAACGIYSVVRSQQYKSLQEDVASPRVLAEGYHVTDAPGIVFIEDMKRYLDALRAGETDIAEQEYGIISTKLEFQAKNAIEAADRMLKQYGGAKDKNIVTLTTYIDAALRELKTTPSYRYFKEK